MIPVEHRATERYSARQSVTCVIGRMRRGWLACQNASCAYGGRGES